jgi:hypothetical protein
MNSDQYARRRFHRLCVRHLSRSARAGVALCSVVAAQGCLDRPVYVIPPGTSGAIVLPVAVSRVDKVDLLFMVDNSASMADKQSELTRRVPELIQALTDPVKDPKTGKKPKAVHDIHVGVISSSLGDHGTGVCNGGAAMNDRGRLLPRDPVEATGKGYTVGPTDADCPVPVASSAVSWVLDSNPKEPTEFKGSRGQLELEAGTSCLVRSVGEHGCGFEAQLESIYHFLIDPAPYAEAAIPGCNLQESVACDPKTPGCSRAGTKICGIEVSGVDTVLLAQRAAFLRPDSLLAIIMITDENDASLKPAGDNGIQDFPYGMYWHDANGNMPRGWGSCASLPDDFEPEDYREVERRGCKWCAVDGSDANCSKHARDKGSTDWDDVNLRAFEQVRRFGVNGLWGRERYVKGFTQPIVLGSDGKLGPNGIYNGGRRPPSQVVVAAIVGVPESLVTRADGTPKELADTDWEKIVSPDHSKRDAHMIESITPRQGIPLYRPPTGDPLTAFGAAFADPINGGDRPVSSGFKDLQFACIGKRASREHDEGSTDCTPGDDANPLCAPGGLQPRYKAYPSLRELRVLHEVALSNAGVGIVAASICAEKYSGAVAGIVEKMQIALNNQCIPTSLEQDPLTKDVTCLVAEVFESSNARTAADDGTTATVCEQVGKGYCTPGKAPCRVPTDDSATGRDFQEMSAVDAAKDLALPITVVNPSTGEANVVQTPAFEEGGNVYVQAIGADGRRIPTAPKHLVCEMLQLAKHRGETPADSASCVDTNPDPDFTPSTGGGWCYSQNAAMIADRCRVLGATGTVRFLGATKPKSGSQVFTVCVQ